MFSSTTDTEKVHLPGAFEPPPPVVIVLFCRDAHVGRDPVAYPERYRRELIVTSTGKRASRTARMPRRRGIAVLSQALHVVGRLDRLLLDGEGLRLRAAGLMPCQPVGRVLEQEERPPAEPEPPMQPVAVERRCPETTYFTGIVMQPVIAGIEPLDDRRARRCSPN